MEEHKSLKASPQDRLENDVKDKRPDDDTVIRMRNVCSKWKNVRIIKLINMIKLSNVIYLNTINTINNINNI